MIKQCDISKVASDTVVDLVYLDPPYNTGKTFRTRAGKEAYRDAFDGPIDFCEWLKPGLEQAKATMSVNATFWLHLDYRTVHYAKVMCDEIFGPRAFRGEIVWVPGNGARGKGLSVTHQSLLVYAIGSPTWNDFREPLADGSLKTHFRKADDLGRSYRDRVVNGKTYRYYADEGRKGGSVWTDIPAMAANSPVCKESTGYPTQKPLALLERIISISSDPGQTVADYMCGSGTTGIAARRLDRKYVLSDIGEEAIRVSTQRLNLNATITSTL
jgi:site-specific DNA-methyltransferase (adenine-specific)